MRRDSSQSRLHTSEPFKHYREIKSKKRNSLAMEKVEVKLFGTAPRALWLFEVGLTSFFDSSHPAALSGPGQHKAMRHKRNG
jgi:hypothetical protein